MIHPRTAPRRAAFGLGAFVGALVLAACGGSSEPAPAADDAAVGAAPTTPTAPPGGADPEADTVSGAPVDGVPAALDFTAPLLDGGEIEMGQFAGRPVLLWFWAPW